MPVNALMRINHLIVDIEAAYDTTPVEEREKMLDVLERDINRELANVNPDSNEAWMIEDYQGYLRKIQRLRGVP